MKQLLLLTLPLLAMQLHVNNAQAQACPNGDFENWNVKAYSQPDSMWYTSNPKSLSQADSLTVWPVTGFSGQAIHIQTAIVGTDTLQAYISNTNSDPQSGKGGVPYSQQPTAITGYYRYNMVAGDSATIIVVFKKSGTPIALNTYKISNATGSVSTFTQFSLPLSTLAIAPDSVIVAAASSNVMANIFHSGSWLELDQVEFTTSQPLPGGSFNTWMPDTLFAPVSWAVGQSGQNGNGVLRSPLHYSGNYSIELTSQASGGGGGGPVSTAQITTGVFSPNSGTVGGLPYTLTTDTLTGYYMYTPAGTDTAGIQVNLYHTGSMVGGNGYYFFAAPSWTYFSIPFSASSTPDTMRIDVKSGSFFATVPGSVLHLDYMQLKSHPLPPVAVNNIGSASGKVIAYPNPANDVLNISYDNTPAPMSAKLYDVMGKTLDSRNYTTPTSIISFPVAYLPSGLYFYEVTINGNTTRGKFLKK